MQTIKWAACAVYLQCGKHEVHSRRQLQQMRTERYFTTSTALQTAGEQLTSRGMTGRDNLTDATNGLPCAFSAMRKLAAAIHKAGKACRSHDELLVDIHPREIPGGCQAR